MILFKYKHRIQIAIMKLMKEKSEIESTTFRSTDIRKQVDLIIRKNQINHDIELLNTLL